jgi:BTB/POZ domain
MSEPSNTPMNFNESQHGSTLLERLRQQRESGRFCDVTLYVSDRTFRAHRSVLASCSAYFASVFQTRRAVRERLTVTCRDPEAFSALINYMYTGSVALDRANVGEILRLANHFIVPRLKVSKFLKQLWKNHKQVES